MFFTDLTIVRVAENNFYYGKPQYLEAPPAPDPRFANPEAVYEVHLNEVVIGKILILEETVEAFSVHVQWDCQSPYLVERPLGKPVSHGHDDKKKYTALLSFAKRISAKCHICSRCKEVNTGGHMFDKDVCQACAEHYMGVVY